MPLQALPRRSAVRLVHFFFWFLLLPSAALAHPGHYHPDEIDEFDAFMPGLMHPLGGFDHLLLALAVGWLAFSRLKSAPRVVLAVFLTSLIAGAIIGSGADGGVVVELLLAGTLLAAGAASLIATRKTGAAGFMVATAGAGMLHGFAHGSEALAPTGFPFYLLGVVACTALLCCMGGLLASLAKSRYVPISRAVGLLLLGSGLFGVLSATL